MVPSPNLGTHDNFLIGVTTVLANDIWTVGAYNDSPYIMNTMIEHWNGSQWSVVPTPNIKSHDDCFQGLAADSANDLWAVGADNDPVHHQQLTLIEHCC
jgi:hypothetical protein